MVKQTKAKMKLKHKHFSQIIFVKLVIPAGKKYRQSKTLPVKALVDSGVSEYIIAKAKADKLPVKKTRQELQWSTSSGVLTTNTKTATSFSFLLDLVCLSLLLVGFSRIFDRQASHNALSKLL